MPAGWGEEFDDEDSPNEKAVESLIPKQPQQGVEDLSGQHLSKFDDVKQLEVGVWKNEVIETFIEEMQEQLVCLPPEEELSLDLASLAFRIENNFLVVFILVIDDMNSDYAYSCIVHPDKIVHCDTGRICMFGINLISTRFIQYGHK